jgi:cytochrome oxidase Cu insertion factor (SCO1/SenC/PrrC family)/mono/diheme cytochrome c family protein
MLGAVALGAALLVGLAACGDDSGDTALSEAGQSGREIATANGCAGCHGVNGQGGVGPTWQGLAGSEVELEDGRTVIADDDYLYRAITDPNAEMTEGYSLQMPQNQLSDDEVADVIAYIRDLGGDSTAADGRDDQVVDDAEESADAGSTVDGGATGVAGIVREPAPTVDSTALPSLAHPGEDVEFRAASEAGVQVVYFGYTSCPDVCPTTMADLAVALRKLPAGMADRVETVFVTVDPARDLDIAAEYAQSFVPDADAAGTLDEELLADAAEPFGVVYSVDEVDGEVVVEHSPFLYLVNDEGELLVTWQFGESSDNIAADVEMFLERGGEPL